MNRRELLQRSAVLFGGYLLGADQLVAKPIDWDLVDSLNKGKGFGLFSKSEIRMMNEIAETVIPATNVPGAKAADVGRFMAVIVSDCYEANDQKLFKQGLAELEAAAKARFKSGFMKLKPAQRTELLADLDKAQAAVEKSKKNGEPSHYFRTMKGLIIWGYFTSEIGATMALRWVEYPGRYETIEYKKGDRNFFA